MFCTAALVFRVPLLHRGGDMVCKFGVGVGYEASLNAKLSLGLCCNANWGSLKTAAVGPLTASRAAIDRRALPVNSLPQLEQINGFPPVGC